MPKAFSPLTRLLHWLNAVCVLGLTTSGWAIYNAAPFYPFEFPKEITLGGYLTPALRWHFLFMWGLMFGATLQIFLRVFLARGGPALSPIHSKILAEEFVDTLKLRLMHSAGIYVHTQRLLYLTVFALFVLVILSGLALWKPVQLQFIAEGLGGYEAVRRWHFWSMAGLVGFILIHVAMVMIVPSTLLVMLFGAQPEKEKE
ncbi:cytochrome b/b6 domain-containing protein [Litoreibacter roseus]|uniref:Thioredoxin reductase n=1 Tax=Litoreibacter roseus TaxID=2601869 RepID=A0A6N6JL42_9RHOB|nr:cytochrome b/b6 domain-containing protein [Litoreibacter roseus]GFE67023.1 thioredoxin reductase [Litoreibacter roseus]